jgi:hypothetical protein
MRQAVVQQPGPGGPCAALSGWSRRDAIGSHLDAASALASEEARGRLRHGRGLQKLAQAVILNPPEGRPGGPWEAPPPLHDCCTRPSR